MAKRSDELVGGSFHNVTITSTINDLMLVLGEPQVFDNTGRDKVNVEWSVITNKGFYFTIYDWKEYRVLGLDETIRFHIGSTGGRIQEYEAVGELISDIQCAIDEAKTAILLDKQIKSKLGKDAFNALNELNELNKFEDAQ